MSEKHTPGPWGFDEKTWIVWADNGDTSIAIIDRNFRTTKESRIANGYLIADAPEMLRLLREVMSDKKEIGDTLTDIRELLRRHGDG
jgi:hypothetical protein